MDGLKLVKTIRRRNKDIPIVMVTSERDAAQVATAMEAGCSEYLKKPFTAGDLRHTLEKWIPGRLA